MGTRRVFDWLDGNPRARLMDYSVGVSGPRISRIAGFVSINSALEVDLAGNVNAETWEGDL